MRESASLEWAFLEHRPFLWSLAYRLTGCAADADDLVQDAFVRAMGSPPADTGRPWRPWLTRVTLNLGRDLLRRRRRRGYVGPWLPSPVETGLHDDPPSFDPPDLTPGPQARYDLMESVSVAFLVALEALTPAQRGILLLRDVLDYSVRETAAALGMTEANVKTTHLRARRAMKRYDTDRRPLGGEERERNGLTLERFLSALGARDAAALETLLATDVVMSSDGGGEFVAARRLVLGRDKVMRFLLGLGAKFRTAPSVEVRVLNGLPAAIVSGRSAPPGWASKVVLQLRLERSGLISHVSAVLASRKLTALGEAFPEGKMQESIRRLPSFTLMGVARRVSNLRPDEIGQLWRDFHSQGGHAQIGGRKGDDVFALYCDYEGDHTKPFTMLIGCEVEDLGAPSASLTLRAVPQAKYAVFDATGPQPDTLIATWRRIWDEPLERAFTADFDRYTAEGRVEVFVAVR